MKFVRTLAPAWAADKRPIYGGFFWLNGDGTFPAPTEAYYMAGVGGQTVLIIPSHDLVIVPPAVEDWGNGGAGRWFEHLGPRGMTFTDKASFKAHLRAEGLQEWAPKRGMPGQAV